MAAKNAKRSSKEPKTTFSIFPIHIQQKRCLFFIENRSEILGTLHRISSVKNRERRIIGFIYKIGRCTEGAANLIQDEITGFSNIPHKRIEKAWRRRDEQYNTLLEAVQNHNPQVIVVDEIKTSKEVQTIKSRALRGVSVVGSFIKM
jgi:stage III sporulation protein SpoIIIAA